MALKGNQNNLHKDVADYFDDADFREKIKKDGGYHRIAEKAHGQIEIKEYYQTDDINWLHDKKKWKGLKSIGIIITSFYNIWIPLYAVKRGHCVHVPLLD